MKNFKDKDEDSEINSFQNISLGNGSKNKRMIKFKNKDESDDDSDEMNKSSNGKMTNNSHHNNHKGINLKECFDDTNLLNNKDNDLSN